MTLNKVLKEAATTFAAEYRLRNGTDSALAVQIHQHNADKVLKEAQSQIEKDLLVELEKKKPKPKIGSPMAWQIGEDGTLDTYDAGYNQALKDVEKLIKTYCRGESNE